MFLIPGILIGLGEGATNIIPDHVQITTSSLRFIGAVGFYSHAKPKSLADPSLYVISVFIVSFFSVLK